MNELLFVAEALLCFGAVVLCEKRLGLQGITAWIPVAMILANLMTPKTVELFGFEATLGTILFASTFLATDIIVENYGVKEAQRAIVIGMCATVVFIIASQIALLYIPAVSDIANGSMTDLFALNIRTSLASVFMCFIANMLDIKVFQAIKNKTGDKKLWFRNTAATLLCNCGENFAFVFLAFAGILPLEVVLTIAVTTSILEAVLALFDTPFVYMAKSKFGRSKALLTTD